MREVNTKNKMENKIEERSSGRSGKEKYQIYGRSKRRKQKSV